MKLLLALLGFVLFVNHGLNADQALVQKLKPYEKYSPYEWTKWLELRPPQGRQPVAAAAVAYAPYGYEARPPPSSDEVESAEEDEDEYGDTVNPFDQWFKRAILPAAPAKKPKKSKDKDDTATKKPSIVDVPLDFWGPPPSVAPNVTLPPPPGYWAAKKSMFVSKLFAALAASVLNTTGPPALGDPITTTVSPRQAILDEIESVLLSDVARSVATEESDEESEEDDDSKEAQAAPAPETTTVNPFLLTKQDFLEKLTAAILAQPQAAAPVVAPVAPKPTKPAPTPASKKPAKGGKAGKKGKADKKATKAPKYLKYIPTTTTTEPPPTIDYDALAKALLGGNSK